METFLEEPFDLILLGLALFGMFLVWDKKNKIGKYTVLILSLVLIISGILLLIFK